MKINEHYYMKEVRDMFKKILVGIDGSEHSEKALGIAVEVAKVFGASLTLISVVQMPIVTDFAGEEQILSKDIYETIVSTYRVVLDKASKLVENPEQFSLATRVEFGNPGNEICKVAKEENYDLIVMGSRGKGILQRHLLGSVSDRVNHHAHCCVLIVK